MTELINAAMQTNSEYLIAPYYSTPQLVYLFREKMVQAVIGSLSCLMYQNSKAGKPKEGGDPEDLTQIITNIDLELGSFKFVDKWEIVSSFNLQSPSLEPVSDLFIVFGSSYGFKMAT